MTQINLVVLVVLDILSAFAGYAIGAAIGKARERNKWRDELMRNERDGRWL